MRSKNWIAIGAACLCASGIVYATQTVNYTYDALGRLTGAQIVSGAGNGTTETYNYDAAGNRLSYQVSGSPGESSVTLNMTNTTVNMMSAGATITIQVSASSANGTLDLTENGVYLGSTWVTNGQATIVLLGYSKGTHNIVATYSGDGTHAAQTTNFTIKVQDLRWLPAVLELLLQN
jgi:hypothetical protein